MLRNSAKIGLNNFKLLSALENQFLCINPSIVSNYVAHKPIILFRSMSFTTPLKDPIRGHVSNDQGPTEKGRIRTIYRKFSAK